MQASKQETIKRRRQIRSRLRGLIRVIVLNKYLMNDLFDDFYFGPSYKRKVAILTRRKKKTGPLTTEERILFRKPTELRTKEERERMCKIVASLRCFEKFPPVLRARIAPHLQYIEVGAGRKLIQERNQALYVYYVLAGELIAKKDVFDTSLNAYIEKLFYILVAGDCVGDSAFMDHTIYRPFTVEVTIDAELLFLDSDIFIKYLYDYLLIEWNKLKISLGKYDVYFANFDHMQINYVCRFGEIREYAPNETIYYKDKGILNFAYFVISGECMILQNLRTNVYKTSKNKKKYVLAGMHRKSEIEQQKGLTDFDIIKAIKEMPKANSMDVMEDFSLASINSIEENHFIDIGSFFYGAVFGLGEAMQDRAILARTRVQCLLIPRFWLLEREQNPGNMWQRMAALLDNTIPSREKLLTTFNQHTNWHKYKKNYVNEKLNVQKNLYPTKMEDIPLLCRVIESTYEDE